MTTFIFANNIKTTLASGISSTSTSLTLSSTANLPTSIPSGSVMVLTLNDAATHTIYEIVYVTAINGATLTVNRGQENTAAQAWLTGDSAFSGPTAAQMASFSQDVASGVTPGTYGTSTAVGSFTVDLQGALTAASDINIAFPVTSFNSRTGAITLSAGDVNSALGYTALGASIPADTLLGNPTASSAIPGTITLSDGIQFASGALGLGTITPSGVTITATISNPCSVSSSNGNDTFIDIQNTSTSGRQWAVGTTGSAAIIGSAGSFFLTDQTSGVARLILDGDGQNNFSGAVQVTTSGSEATIIANDTGAYGANILLIGNGATTPNKTIRAISGSLEIVNSAYSAPIFSIDDIGNILTPGDIYGGQGFFSTGSVWIAGTNSAGTLYFRPNGYNSSTGQATLNSSGQFSCPTSNFTSSDQRLKEKITHVEAKPLHRYIDLMEFDRIDTKLHERGIIAQQAQNASPLYVISDSETGMLAVDRPGLALEIALWAAKRIDELLDRIDALEKAP